MTGVPSPFFITLKNKTIAQSAEIPQSIRQMERAQNNNSNLAFIYALVTPGPTIASNLLTTLSWDTTVVSSPGMANSGVWTCPANQGGIWLFTMMVQWQNNTTGFRFGGLNGSYTYDVNSSNYNVTSATLDADGRSSVSQLRFVVPGDTTFAVGLQNSGVALTYVSRFCGIRLLTM